MQIIVDVKQRAQQLLEDNATTLLTAGGVVGTVVTAVLAGRAGFKAAEIIQLEEVERLSTARLERQEANTLGEAAEPPPLLSKTEKFKLVVVYFIPPVITGSATIGSIILANRMSGQKAAALAAAYGLSQKQFEEYKGKVADKLGVQKEGKIQDELAQDRVKNTPGANQIVVVEGEVLCFDQPTGRYFRSTMDAINKAVNSTNAEIIHHDYASASHFYEELGLPATTWTDEVGWNTDQLIELTISTVLAEDDKPCIAIDFKTLPKLDYIRRDY